EGARRRDKLRFAVGEELGTGKAGWLDPCGECEDKDDVTHATADKTEQEQAEQKHRDGSENFDDALDDEVDLAALIAGQDAERDADTEADKRGNQADHHRGARAMNEAGEVVAPD